MSGIEDRPEENDITMKINKTVKGIAFGTSLAAFVTLGVPAAASAANLLDQQKVEQVGDKKADKKKDEKKKDDKKKDEKKKDGEGSCGEGEGSCGEGKCGDDHKGDDGK